MTRPFRVLLLALALPLAPAAFSQERAGSDYPHLKLGNPSGARDDPRDRDNFLMAKPYFALAYNNAHRTPNWVSWRLTRDDLGNAPRVPFYPDPDLPRGFRHVTPRDYSGSGFDRGHLCPHSDRACSREASRATFAMTNMIPQAPNVNQQAWADFEDYCRHLVRNGEHRLYIVAGGAGKGGAGKEGHKEVIGEAEVVVPARCWKVVIVLPEGGEKDDVDKVFARTRVIAVVMPNDESVHHDWARYRTSAKKVERLTGYTFFDRVPADVIGPLKEKVDEVEVRPTRTRGPGRDRKSDD